MGNREDLLAGAVTCLKERGWARTTVRDIAAAAGVSHAAIGYHFGSREELLFQAYVQAMDEWGGEMTKAVEAAAARGADRKEQYAALWDELAASVRTNHQLWLASVEASVVAEHNPQMRELMTSAMREGRRGLAAGLTEIPEDDVDDKLEFSVGAVQMALVSGLMFQWLFAGEKSPSGADVVAGLTALADQLR
ncbi:TetR/AcrR family transcriptional regulator [Labedaea rhizosphaerae]|uniref:TetR family transcriptional regulator n=1 Tax=Labedaea rhizosphaerae TaxID=598644 RepID=A0A4R6SDQ4_LABRH|nr:TetR/AcrR family transcriptional regulator [Labedaea rhizosphaerae]TDP97817.1 TetR family transcriptional regulator [Labedaea rhizosphaerae]